MYQFNDQQLIEIRYSCGVNNPHQVTLVRIMGLTQHIYRYEIWPEALKNIVNEVCIVYIKLSFIK